MVSVVVVWVVQVRLLFVVLSQVSCPVVVLLRGLGVAVSVGVGRGTLAPVRPVVVLLLLL